jgi:hypothetical protein
MLRAAPLLSARIAHWMEIAPVAAAESAGYREPAPQAGPASLAREVLALETARTKRAARARRRERIGVVAFFVCFALALSLPMLLR